MTVRCFVGLYGLNRSLRWTYKSLLSKIIRPVTEYGASVRCMAHFNEPSLINNSATGEIGIPIGRRGLRRLPLDVFACEPQLESSLPASVVSCIDNLPGGPRLESRQTMINLLFQLHSLRQLWRLREIVNEEYDFYIFLRPDLEYLDELPIGDVVSQVLDQGIDLVTARWHQWGGLNDRFAVCSSKGAEVFANRLACVEKFCEINSYLHAESLLSSAAAWNELRLGFIDTRAMRVRADGATYREGFELTWPAFVRSVARKRAHKLRRLLLRASG